MEPHQGVEPNQREVIGYSIQDPEKKAQWIALVHGISDWIEANGLCHDIVFHGTSATRLSAILEGGLEPTYIDEAVPTGSLDNLGSFWGDIHTAASYAEDTAFERDDGCSPVLLMIRIEDLLAGYKVYPDLASFNYPLRGLTRLDEPDILAKWESGFETMSWWDGLNDLRAIVAAHDTNIPASDLSAVVNLESVKKLMDTSGPRI